MNTRIFLTLLGLVVAISCQNFEDDDDIIEASGLPVSSTGSSSSHGSSSATPPTAPDTNGNSTSTGSPPSIGTTAPPGPTNTSGTGMTGFPPSTGTTAPPGPTNTSGTGMTGFPPSTGTTAFISNTTQPAPTIPMESFTMPNSVSAPNAKVIYQQAVALTNHVQALSAQILTLQNEINPENSTLIIDVWEMQKNATNMLSTLDCLTARLDAANKNLTAAQDNYNNVSRTYTCIASYYGYPTTMAPSTTVTTIAPTTTVPPWTCDRNLEASGTSQTVTFDRVNNGTTCSYTVTAAASSGTITYTLVLSVSANGSVSVVDVNSGATLDTFTNTTATYNNQTSTTVVRFVANNAQFVNYNLTYSAYDPCSHFGCDANCSTCSLNSLAQPFCKLNSTDPCASIGGDGKCQPAVDPCKGRGGKGKCDSADSCIRSNTTCTATCNVTTTVPPQFLRLRDDEDEDSVRGLLHRWVF